MTHICYPSIAAVPGRPGHPAIPGHPAWPAHPATATNFNAGWTGGGISIDTIPGDGHYSFSCDQSVVGVVTGISTMNLGVGYVEIPHAIYLHSGVYTIVESGVQKTSPVAYNSADVFSVVRRGTRVQYYVRRLNVGAQINIYNSAVPSSGVFFADCSLYFGGDQVR